MTLSYLICCFIGGHSLSYYFCFALGLQYPSLMCQIMLYCPYIARILLEFAPISPLQAFVLLLSYVLPLNSTTCGYCFALSRPLSSCEIWKLKTIFLFPHRIVPNSHFNEEIQFSAWCHCPVCRTSLKCFLQYDFSGDQSLLVLLGKPLYFVICFERVCWMRNFRWIGFKTSLYLNDSTSHFLDCIVSRKESVVHACLYLFLCNSLPCSYVTLPQRQHRTLHCSI